jgi:hypothetical protein
MNFKVKDINVNVLRLINTTGEYEKIVDGSIEELFFDTNNSRRLGLFYFEDFIIERFEDIINNLIVEDENIVESEFIKEFERFYNISINSKEDILIYGIYESNGKYINVSECENEKEFIKELNSLLTELYGEYPSPKGSLSKIKLEIK